MKIYKIGENKYYKGECETCGTGVICNQSDDCMNMNCRSTYPEGATYSVYCPNCNVDEIKLVEITKEEYDELAVKALNK